MQTKNLLSPYHPKVFQRFHNHHLLFIRTLRLLSCLRLWLIVILSLNDVILLLRLRNIKVGHLHPIIMLCRILLNFFVSSLTFHWRDIQFIHIHSHIHMMLCFVKFGQKCYRLHSTWHELIAWITMTLSSILPVCENISSSVFWLTSVCRNISSLFKLLLFEGTYQLLFEFTAFHALGGLGLSSS